MTRRALFPERDALRPERECVSPSGTTRHFAPTACCPRENPRSRTGVKNTLGGNPQLKFIAMVVQGIPRSYKVDSQLSFVDVPLCPLS